MQRTTLTIDGHEHVLAQGTDLDAPKRSAEAAVRDGGRFVDVTVVGNIAVSILASRGVPIYLSTRKVLDDSRDTGDLAAPYDDSAWQIPELC